MSSDMDRFAELKARYEQACEAERSHWTIVKGTHPGTPGHSPAAWKQWLEAAERVRTLASQLKSITRNLPSARR